LLPVELGDERWRVRQLTRRSQIYLRGPLKRYTQVYGQGYPAIGRVPPADPEIGCRRFEVDRTIERPGFSLGVRLPTDFDRSGNGFAHHIQPVRVKHNSSRKPESHKWKWVEIDEGAERLQLKIDIVPYIALRPVEAVVEPVYATPNIHHRDQGLRRFNADSERTCPTSDADTCVRRR
jgi:hypothetical protein